MVWSVGAGGVVGGWMRKITIKSHLSPVDLELGLSLAINRYWLLYRRVIVTYFPQKSFSGVKLLKPPPQFCFEIGMLGGGFNDSTPAPWGATHDLREEATFLF